MTNGFGREAAAVAHSARLVGRAVAGADRSGQGRDRQEGPRAVPPLRLALTGRESGPEMAGLLERMGKDRAFDRLEAAARR